MSATAIPSSTLRTRPRGRVARRVLGSGLVDILVGPHGIDRYLELVRPEMTIGEARARIVAVERQTPRSVTLRIRPNAAWAGFEAGQFVRVGVEIDGVRRTRTYSPASSHHRSAEEVELTISFLPDGLVSSYLRQENPGGVVFLGTADGSFTLPAQRPERLALISGGSGVTPVMSMLRTLIDEGHDGEITWIHYGPTRDAWLYERQVRELAARHPNIRVEYVATREGGARFDRDALGLTADTVAAVCGPPRLIEAVREQYADAPQNVLSETFTPPSLTVTGEQVEGTLRFLKSGSTAEIQTGTLLEQAEAAGLTPEFGCRMGICHSCTCRKTAGTVKNILTGEVSDEEDENIQLCISVPAGDVALDI
jgi:stearoyl-CoA 9-desaturase NADPH oxidoreductase